ncbi:unnamed protein product [Trifolium pratense]|uniref:Uncharacterized protein n=1 Tax=Trifolium pratense TaxID=57577 RepID=A0ACB0IH32_TRIPR|nr:unnamed protein product [Trifolium pratense]
MDSILRSSSFHFHPLFLSSLHFNTLRPTSTYCSQSHSNSNTTTNSNNSQQNPTWVSFPLAQIIKKVAAFKIQNRVFNENQQGCCYLQNGGLGVALLSVTANAKVKISPFVATLASNPTFVSGLFAWFVAQSIKVFLNFFVERKWDLRLMCASGGMPSSHSALCTALTTSVALCHGVADSLFPVCLGFSLIVMYDAIGVRRHAGMQAQKIVCVAGRRCLI